MNADWLAVCQAFPWVFIQMFLEFNVNNGVSVS